MVAKNEEKLRYLILYGMIIKLHKNNFEQF